MASSLTLKEVNTYNLQILYSPLRAAIDPSNTSLYVFPFSRVFLINKPTKIENEVVRAKIFVNSCLHKSFLVSEFEIETHNMYTKVMKNNVFYLNVCLKLKTLLRVSCIHLILGHLVRAYYF